MKNHGSTPVTGEPVAVTGVAITCALGDETGNVWKAVTAGRSGIATTKRFDVSSLRCQISAELPFSPPRVGAITDRATLMALKVAQEAIDSAQLRLLDHDPYRLGVGLGTSVGGLEQGERWQAQLIAGGVGATRARLLLGYPLYSAADALAAHLGLKGPKVVISNACAAGANAIGWAADEIRLGRADVMVAGGVDVLDLLSLAGFDSLKALDSEACAPLSRSTGLNLGEGVGMLVLESASSALRREAEPLAWFRGYGLSSDAHHATAPDPQGNGAHRSMQRAIVRGGLTPDDIDYLNAHGTGTPANDSAEPRAVDALFGDHRPPMSSTKSQVGHTLGAAGAVESVVTVLAIRDGQLPPTINVDAATPQDHDIVPNLGRPGRIHAALSNSFAFGGNNCSLAFGDSPDPFPPPLARRRVVVTGAGAISGLATGRTELWAAVEQGVTAVAPARRTDVSLSTSPMAAELPDDRHHRWIERSYLRRVDQIGTLVLAVSRMALDDAAAAVNQIGRERVGMVFGTFTGPLETVGSLTRTITTAGPDQVSPRLFPNSVVNAAVGHACLSLQVKGPLSTLATGCAAGLQALGYAADMIADGEADLMVAVAADELTPELHLGFDRLGVLGRPGSTAYSSCASGLVPGAGAAALVLEDYEHAVARGATILGEVLSHATTSDAFRMAGNEPSGDAWAHSMRLAVERSEVPADQVGAVYGDARGTRVLDRAEARAVNQVWPDGIPLANLSPQTGHLGATTAMLSAVTALRTCATGWVPVVPGVAHPIPELGLADIQGTAPVAAEGFPGVATVVTAANWGGTYASVVLAPAPR
ncbi:beta-ketoacyl-[acyl-carrier-protein] synthase family protein [Microlunatus lacustris]